VFLEFQKAVQTRLGILREANSVPQFDVQYKQIKKALSVMTPVGLRCIVHSEGTWKVGTVEGRDLCGKENPKNEPALLVRFPDNDHDQWVAIGDVRYDFTAQYKDYKRSKLPRGETFQVYCSRIYSRTSEQWSSEKISLWESSAEGQTLTIMPGANRAQRDLGADQTQESVLGTCGLVLSLKQKLRQLDVPIEVRVGEKSSSDKADFLSAVSSLSNLKAQAVCEAVWAGFLKSPTAFDWITSFKRNNEGATFEIACRELMKAYRCNEELKARLQADENTFSGRWSHEKAGIMEDDCSSEQLRVLEMRKQVRPKGGATETVPAWYGRVERVACFAERHHIEERAVAGRHMLLSAVLAFDDPRPLEFLGKCLAGHFVTVEVQLIFATSSIHRRTKIRRHGGQQLQQTRGWCRYSRFFSQFENKIAMAFMKS
jgi:hypothetical protein